MKITVRNTCHDFDSYRAARVKSLFNVDSGADFSLDAELPIEGDGWQIGVIVGPSGSGKSSIGRQLGIPFAPSWPNDAPIIDAIAPGGDVNAVFGALSAVGLGSVPAWLRPFHVLSNGEQFRANLARLVCDAPPFAVVDEFSSVVDRQIARVGPVIRQGWCHVLPGETPAELWRRALAPMGLRLLSEALGDFAEGAATATPQDPRTATWEPAFKTAPLSHPPG